jgi:hypothetical protein
VGWSIYSGVQVCDAQDEPHTPRKIKSNKIIKRLSKRDIFMFTTVVSCQVV